MPEAFCGQDRLTSSLLTSAKLFLKRAMKVVNENLIKITNSVGVYEI